LHAHAVSTYNTYQQTTQHVCSEIAGAIERAQACKVSSNIFCDSIEAEEKKGTLHTPIIHTCFARLNQDFLLICLVAADDATLVLVHLAYHEDADSVRILVCETIAHALNEAP
jgi:hypothetical protein